MVLLGVYIGIGAFLACLVPGCMCFFNSRRYTAERDAHVRELEAQAEQAAAAAERVLAARLASGSTDPLIDQAIGQIGSRLN